MLPQLHLKITFQADKKINDYLLDGMEAYNKEHTGHLPQPDPPNFTIILRDEQHTVYGGLMGDIAWEGLKIHVLWMEEPFRRQGYGSQLLEQAEELAQEQQCRLIHLETTSFHSYDFYLKHGFREVGKIENYPVGETMYWMVKELGEKG